MIQLTFTNDEIDQLNYECYHHPHPRVQRKMETLWLKSQKLPHHQICQLAGISSTTLTRYLHSYQVGGIDQLKVIHFHKPQSALVSFHSSIEFYLEENPL